MNQIQDIPIGNNQINKNTRSDHDGGIQCLFNRLDIFSLQVPGFSCKHERVNFSFDSVRLSGEVCPFSRTNVLNNKNKRQSSQIAGKIRINALESVHCWNKRCNFTTRSNSVSSFLNIMKKNKSLLSKCDVAITPAHLKEKFIVPDMQSYKDKETTFQYFSPLSLRARMELKKKQRWSFPLRIWWISFYSIKFTKIYSYVISVKTWFGIWG